MSPDRTVSEFIHHPQLITKQQSNWWYTHQPLLFLRLSSERQQPHQLRNPLVPRPETLKCDHGLETSQYGSAAKLHGGTHIVTLLRHAIQ